MNRQECHSILGLSIFLLTGPFVGRAGAVDIRSDFDHDCDVDAADLAHLKMCALGPSVPQTNPACVDARLDADPDVDLDDFGIFQRCYSGEGNAANPNCDPPCSGPQCACLCSQTNCNGTCTCIASDSANCGTCGNVCPAGTTCVNGTCSQTTCVFPAISCGGVCVVPTSDPHNCGGCGVQCGETEACINGFCESGFAAQAAALSASAPLSARVCPPPPSCPQPWLTFCNPVGCVDLMINPSHCGACFNQCAQSDVCAGGTCQGPCSGCE